MKPAASFEYSISEKPFTIQIESAEECKPMLSGSLGQTFSFSEENNLVGIRVPPIASN